jgi:hypothetical protein
MNGTNKVFIIIFCFVISPLSFIGSLVLKETLSDKAIVSEDYTEQLNWFQENEEISENIITGLNIVAEVFLFVAIILLISMSQGGRSSDDAGIGRRLQSS